MKCHVVIGSNFGDEGKGMTTDYLCRNLDHPVVVRFNGGSQAGHTVTTPTGERHVFKHVGSGTFAGAATYLSEYFVVNPLELIQEIDRLYPLSHLIESRNIMIHPDAKLSTPYDIMINWALENKRRDMGCAHGSCGFGIGQTEARHESIPLTVSDIGNFDVLHQKLIGIRQHYDKTITEMGLIDHIDDSFYDDIIIQDFIGKCNIVANICDVLSYSALSMFENIIFEGAQGLLLDQNHEWFPHVTRSNTGMINVESIIQQFAEYNPNVTLNEVDVYYVTRSYLTRHGNGPLPHEVSGKIYPNIVDATNFTNHFQGKLRFAPLNLDLLNTHIERDMATVNLNLNSTLVVTCFNQLADPIKYVLNEEVHDVGCDMHAFSERITSNNPCDRLLISTSPDATGFLEY